MANALDHRERRRNATWGAGAVLTVVSIIISGCGQQSTPPSDSQSAKPDHANPLAVESGESPSRVETSSPFSSPRFTAPPFSSPEVSAPPFSAPPFSAPPFSAPPFAARQPEESATEGSPSVDSPADAPLAGDTAPPGNIPNSLGGESENPLDHGGGTLVGPDVTRPNGMPPGIAPREDVPPSLAPPGVVRPDVAPFADRGSPEAGPTANPANESPNDSRGNPLRTDSTAGHVRARLNPLRAGSAGFAPTRQRFPRASLSDSPAVEAEPGLREPEAGAEFPREATAGLEPDGNADMSDSATRGQQGPRIADRNRFRSPAATSPSTPLSPPPTNPPPANFPPSSAAESPSAPSPFPPLRPFPSRPNSGGRRELSDSPGMVPGSNEPTVDDPAPIDPAPGDPAPGEPAPSDPNPSEPGPSEPAPLDPSTTTPAGADPAGADPAAIVPPPAEAPSSGSENPPESGAGTTTSGDFTSVRVFYATDRARLDAFDLGKLSWRPLPWLPVVALGAVAFALITGSMFRRLSGRAWVAGIAAATSAVLVLAAGGPLYLGQVSVSKLVERIAGASRPAEHRSSTEADAGYAGERSSGMEANRQSFSTPVTAAVDVYGNGRGQLEFGECEVTIPRRHEPGTIERPSLWRLEFHESLDRHVVLRSVERRGENAFFAAVRERVASSPRSDLFVFIHGYNVSFEMAARRTAQMAHDLKFEGAPIFYSWPSQGGLLKYPVDETNVAWTVPHLKQFLRQVAAHSEARAINIIAHSMGNRALASAVRELSLEQPLREKRFEQIVLAAPDIDAEVFQRDVAPLLARSAEHVTLYASSRDQALAASKLVHGYPRAGDSGANLLVIPGIETVDVTEVDTGILGHSYYGNSVPILRDLERILHGALTIDQRPWLQTAQRDGHSYWVFNDKSLAILRGTRHR